MATLFQPIYTLLENPKQETAKLARMLFGSLTITDVRTAVLGTTDLVRLVVRRNGPKVYPN